LLVFFKLLLLFCLNIPDLLYQKKTQTFARHSNTRNFMLMVQALCFHSSNDLTVRNLRITNTPGAHIAINGCIGATFSHLHVNSPGNSPNTDGFDISHSKNITVVDSIIATGQQSLSIQQSIQLCILYAGSEFEP